MRFNSYVNLNEPQKEKAEQSPSNGKGFNCANIKKTGENAIQVSKTWSYLVFIPNNC